MYNEKAKGTQIRSKFKWMEKEKITKWFLGLEKKENNTLQEVKRNEKTFSSNSEILQKMCNV